MEISYKHSGVKESYEKSEDYFLISKNACKRSESKNKKETLRWR